MEYRLQDLIDVPRFQELLDWTNRAFGFPTAILDAEANVLTASGWQSVCTRFHRVNPETADRCRASDLYLVGHLLEANPSVSYSCANGLMDAATPIFIEGRYLGAVFIGQFFLEPPDLERFRAQARTFGFEEQAYLDAVRGVPILDHATLDRNLAFLRNFTEFVAQVGLERLRELRIAQALEKSEARVRELNDELEQRVQRRTAELGVANRELESFAYSVSHDLRSPLRGIDGWSQALLEDYGPTLDATAREYLATIRSETQRMGTLIDSLLGLSRVTRAGLDLKRVDLGALARPILERLRAENPTRRAEIVVGEGLDVVADEALMRALLENLLGNAWKFTARRDVARVELGRTTIEGESVVFVRDNGAGFDMAYASKLFTPFQRLHRVDDFPGTGIGLATVQRIIHRHGGRVWAEGQVDGGATVYFTL